MLRLRLSLALALLLLAGGSVVGSGVAATGGARPGARVPATVASLDPAGTEALWSRLVSTPARRAGAAQAGTCRPLRAVFYAATDWLRLATKLAAAASPCAEYYIAVPAVVGNRTQLRRNAASRIRALGPNFHAMAEIHFTHWSRWVAETGSSWHTAGVTARQRMAEAGYDVALGDTWQLNELSTAVRRGEGTARANIREFVRGLYEGDGSRPTKGAVLVVGVGQRTGDVSVYQNTLQSWLADTAFWADMAAYVSDWSQEVYGDVRSHAVPGVPTHVRREFLNDYLQHKLVLSGAAPAELEPARSFLREAYSPLANGAWQRESGYGWTMVSADQMSAYVSAQVAALRYHSASSGQPRDHWGFAWAPRNATGLSAADFAAQSGQVLDRLATAIRDSGSSLDPESPGSAACGPPGQDLLCAGDLPEARHNEGWRAFRGWTQPLLRLGELAATIPAGTPSPPIGLSLVTGTGASLAVPTSTTVTLRSSSPTGSFATSAAGPWTPTLTLTVSAGSGAVPVVFHHLDTAAGTHTLTASGAGATTGTRTVAVAAGPVATLRLAPSSGQVRARGVRRFTASAADVFGNAVDAAGFSWSVRPAGLGTIQAGPGGTATFTAGRLLRTGTIVVQSAGATGGVVATAGVTVVAARLRIAPVAFRPGKRGVRVLLATVDGARRPVSRAALRVVVLRDGRRVLSARVRTGAAGKALVRAPGRGCFTVVVRRAAAQGFRWDGRTPRNRVCRR